MNPRNHLSEDGPHQSEHALLIWLSAALVYFASGELSLFLHGPYTYAPLIWLPSGIGTAFCIIFGLRAFPGVVVGALFVVLSQIGPIDSWERVVGLLLQMVAGPTQVLISAYLYNRLTDAALSINHAKKLFLFGGTACVIGPIASAVMGSTALCLNDLAPFHLFPVLTFNWWYADALGVFVVVPLALSVAKQALGKRVNYPGNLLELTGLILIAGLLTWLAIKTDVLLGYPTEVPTLFILIPVIIYAAFRFYLLGAALIAGEIVLISVALSAFSFGPLVQVGDQSNIVINAFITIVMITSISMGCAFLEKYEAEGRLVNETIARQGAERIAMLDAVGAELAHEINQPLSTASIYVNLARSGLFERKVTEEQLQTWLAKASSANDLASEIIQRIRTFTSVGADLPAEVNVKKALQQSIDVLRPTIDKSGVKVSVSCDEKITFHTNHRTLAQQAVINLIRNAVESVETLANRNGEVHVTGYQEKDNSITIAVSDNSGASDGFSLVRSGESFFSSKPEGMGIGLALIKSIVERSGGKLFLDRTATDGHTVIKLSLPDE